MPTVVPAELEKLEFLNCGVIAISTLPNPVGEFDSNVAKAALTCETVPVKAICEADPEVQVAAAP